MPTNTKFPPDAPETQQPWIPSQVADEYVDEGELNAALVYYAKLTDTMPKATEIYGYDAAKVQTLKHDTTGELLWVDDPVEG